MADPIPPRFHSYRPADGHRLPHDPFNAIIGPRPIGWICSRDADSNVNLAPYSFFNAFNYTPPIIGFSSQGRKDSLRNIEATGEFVWNLATFDLAQAMNESCRAVAPDVDEFVLAGLTALASELVAPPRVAQSPVSMECRCTQIVRLRDAAGNDTYGWLVLGEVVAVHIDTRLLVDGIYDTAASDTILRGGGPADYFRISADQRFRMLRPA
ncbi:flavin reductase family protein [Stenotrophomonas indicatrix]|uniref:flavin reductase family protein n=1 Tax=Stenotrophomonas indicatrix TaxID=2045451 RepID=UPI001AA14D93|nr:flavin reductase family protein [Stenotrophomonas indicatrix]MBO1750027.1 flavin reductase family protein [Stenotrophomonas indicatrix]